MAGTFPLPKSYCILSLEGLQFQNGFRRHSLHQSGIILVGWVKESDRENFQGPHNLQLYQTSKT